MKKPTGEMLSISDIASRWSCDINEVLNYLRDGELVPVLRHERLKLEEMVGEWPKPDLSGELDFSGSETIGIFVAHPGYHFLPLFLYHEKISSENGLALRLSDCVLTNTSGQFQSWYKAYQVANTELCLVSDLCLRAEDVEAYEETHTHDDKPPTQKKLDSAYKTIAALARLLAITSIEDPEKKIDFLDQAQLDIHGAFGSANQPTMNQIADVTVRLLEKSDITLTDLSNSAIRGRISKGLKLLNQQQG